MEVQGNVHWQVGIPRSLIIQVPWILVRPVPSTHLRKHPSLSDPNVHMLNPISILHVLDPFTTAILLSSASTKLIKVSFSSWMPKLDREKIVLFRISQCINHSLINVLDLTNDSFWAATMCIRHLAFTQGPGKGITLRVVM